MYYSLYNLCVDTIRESGWIIIIIIWPFGAIIFLNSFVFCLFGVFWGEGGESYSGTIRKTCIEWHTYAELWSFQQKRFVMAL
jgi:hypothetical protein